MDVLPVVIIKCWTAHILYSWYLFHPHSQLAKGKLEFNRRARKSQVPPLQSLINICGNLGRENTNSPEFNQFVVFRWSDKSGLQGNSCDPSCELVERENWIRFFGLCDFQYRRWWWFHPMLVGKIREGVIGTCLRRHENSHSMVIPCWVMRNFLERFFLSNLMPEKLFLCFSTKERGTSKLLGSE